jgi:hypothetical protein
VNGEDEGRDWTGPDDVLEMMEVGRSRSEEELYKKVVVLGINRMHGSMLTRAGAPAIRSVSERHLRVLTATSSLNRTFAGMNALSGLKGREEWSWCWNACRDLQARRTLEFASVPE